VTSSKLISKQFRELRSRPITRRHKNVAL